MVQLKYIVLGCLFLLSCSGKEKHENVSVSGRQLFVNDAPYFMKGICYHPVEKGSETRSFDRIDADLEIMRDAGINTIRVYLPITERSVLDKIEAAGLKVIIGIGYNQGGKNDILSGSYLEYVNTYKDHNAILLWELGNEYNYHPEWFDGSVSNWYSAMNAAAKAIKEVDSRRPVSTAHGELPDSLALAMSPDIDVWGMNVYRWDNPETLFEQWAEISEKPMFLSEAGADSYMTAAMNGYEEGENEKAQADAVRKILEDVVKNKDVCSGVTLFAFADEWWKAGNPDEHDKGGWAPNSFGVPYDGAPNEEYWGILDIDRNPKAAYLVVKEVFTSN
jgi:hypothetical protein